MIRSFNRDPFAFYCYVEDEGYDWVRGRLIGLGGLGSLVKIREMPGGVFLEFANLKRDAERIRHFANTYGNLFEPYGLSDSVVQRDTLKGGSTLQAWAGEIADMRVLVEIWQATEDQKRRAKLKEIITWKGEDVMYSIKTPRRAMPAAWLKSSHFTPGDKLMPARYALQAEINRRLREPEMLATPRLVWTQAIRKDSPAQDRYQRIIFTPPNLLGALWLQFAQALARKYHLATCEECQKVFIVGPGSGKRADSETCGNACRQRRHVKNKDERKSLR
jgi:hypothetical protein